MTPKKIVPIQETTPVNSSTKTSKRGFASMDPELHRRIASMGGKAVRPESRSFSKNRKLASEAGKKGGVSVPGEKRSFSKNRDLAVRCGRNGGMSTEPAKRSFSVNNQLA